MVAYIYFTRIVVYLLTASIPFHSLWVGDLFTEIATLAFFLLTGYKFRPASDNPYLSVASEDAVSREYGLGDDDMEMAGMSVHDSMGTPSSLIDMKD